MEPASRSGAVELAGWFGAWSRHLGGNLEVVVR